MIHCDCNAIHDSGCIRNYPDPVYYKIAKDRNNPKHLIVIEMQSFDENDYDHSIFLSDTKYQTEKEAEDVIAGIKMWLAEITLGV